jgi:hypothetical protein
VFLKIHRDDVPAAIIKELRTVIGLPMHLNTHHIALRNLFSAAGDTLKSDDVDDDGDDNDGEDEIQYSDGYVQFSCPSSSLPFVLLFFHRYSLIGSKRGCNGS